MCDECFIGGFRAQADDTRRSRVVPCQHPRDFGGAEHEYDLMRVIPPRPDVLYIRHFRDYVSRLREPRGDIDLPEAP